jgi:hypothetical protein
MSIATPARERLRCVDRKSLIEYVYERASEEDTNPFFFPRCDHTYLAEFFGFSAVDEIERGL